MTTLTFQQQLDALLAQARQPATDLETVLIDALAIIQEARAAAAVHAMQYVMEQCRQMTAATARHHSSMPDYDDTQGLPVH